MFVRRKKYSSGKIGIIVAEKRQGQLKELKTIGIATNNNEVERFVRMAQEWIEGEQSRRHPRLDLFEEERQDCEYEIAQIEEVLTSEQCTDKWLRLDS